MIPNENRDENHTFFGSHIKPRVVFICILNGLQSFFSFQVPHLYGILKVLQTQIEKMYDKKFIKFSFQMISRITKPSIFVICLSFRLRQEYPMIALCYETHAVA